ncbi:MAG: nitrogen fixation protein NifZ [Magnetococcales bacterium]|nr:nitrogen fixation protein NifZ [Magnetococcales bacterium]
MSHPRYDYGQAVRVTRPIRNDGTFMGKRPGELLVRRGSVGFVRHYGVFLQNEIVYEVHFIEQGMTVGIREAELQEGNAPWVASEFWLRDSVICQTALGVEGRVVVPCAGKGRVVAVLADDPENILYHVLFDHRVFLVPERVLALDDLTCEKEAVASCSACYCPDTLPV